MHLVSHKIVPHQKPYLHGSLMGKKKIVITCVGLLNIHTFFSFFLGCSQTCISKEVSSRTLWKSTVKELGPLSGKVKLLYSLYCYVQSKAIYSAPARAECSSVHVNAKRI